MQTQDFFGMVLSWQQNPVLGKTPMDGVCMQGRGTERLAARTGTAGAPVAVNMYIGDTY